MEHIKGFNSFEEISEKNWIKDAVKNPGALRDKLGKKEGEKITKAEIAKKTAELKKKDQDKDKKGTQLGKKDAKTLKQLNLAKTLKTIKEGFESEDLEAQFYDIILNNGPEEAAQLCAQLVNGDSDNIPNSDVSKSDEWLSRNRGNIIKNFATESRKHR